MYPASKSASSRQIYLLTSSLLHPCCSKVVYHALTLNACSSRFRAEHSWTTRLRSYGMPWSYIEGFARDIRNVHHTTSEGPVSARSPHSVDVQLFIRMNSLARDWAKLVRALSRETGAYLRRNLCCDMLPLAVRKPALVSLTGYPALSDRFAESCNYKHIDGPRPPNSILVHEGAWKQLRCMNTSCGERRAD